MENSNTNGEHGFTLIELLIAMTIALVVITSISSAFISQRKTYAVQEQISEMQQNARAAMDMMSREIRMAGYDPSGTLQRNDPTEAGGIPFVGIPYDATQLEIVGDLDGDGGTTNANEVIIYKFYNASDANYPNQIKRKTGSGYFQPFVENIEAFTFQYLDANGSVTTTTADIRQIDITITARTAEQDPDYSDPTYSDGYRRYTLTSFITPPNLDL